MIASRLCRSAGSVALLGGLFLLGAPHAAPAVTFLPPSSLAEPGAAALVATDLDGDGKADIAVLGTAGVSLFYGKGDGTFAPRVDLPPGGRLSDIKAADVDGDGRLDLLLADNGQVLMLRNLGNRVYGSPEAYAIGDGPSAIAVADFNGDGRPDFAISNYLSHNMCVLVNHGDGTFAPAVFYAGSNDPIGVTTGDFNGDGKVDLAFTNMLGHSVRIYLGLGNGLFTLGDERQVGSYCISVVCADFNADGKADLATANWMDDTVSLLFGDGAGHFPTRVDYPANAYPGVLAAVDGDGDGDVDLLWGNGGASYFSFLENKGDGTFQPAQRFPSGGNDAPGLAVADLNGDGLNDVVLVNRATGTLGVTLNLSTSILRGPAGHLVGTVPVQNAGNGHWYQVVRTWSSLPWNDARTAAEMWRFRGMAGHLVTLTSAAENQFVTGNVVPGSPESRLWIGACQGRTTPTQPLPPGGWRWVTGEPWSFTSWIPGQPDNGHGAGTEEVVELKLPFSSQWNDLSLSDQLTGYLVEYEPAASALPAQPQNLTLSVPSVTQINLTWTDNSNNETGFEVQRQSPGGAWTTIATLLANVTQYSDPGLTPFSTYLYRVRSFNARGPSAYWSNVAWADTVRPPAVPTGLAVKLIGTVQLDLTWTDNSNNETAFEVWRQIGAGALTRIAVLAPNTTRFSNPGLAPNTSYTFKIKVTGAEGAAWSNSVTGITPPLAPPLPPQNLALSLVSLTQINLSWSDRSDNETTFEIQRQMVGGSWSTIASVGANTTSYADKSVTALHTYIYRVRAVNAAGTSARWSNEAWLDTVIRPAAPTALQLLSTAPDKAVLGWKDNSGDELAFEVWRQTGSGSYQRIAALAPNVTQYTDRNVVAGAVYTYHIRAVGSMGVSVWTNEVSWTVPGH